MIPTKKIPVIPVREKKRGDVIKWLGACFPLTRIDDIKLQPRRWGSIDEKMGKAGKEQVRRDPKGQLACICYDHLLTGVRCSESGQWGSGRVRWTSEARVGAGSESSPLDFLLTGDPAFPEGRLILERTAKQSENMCSRFQVQGYDGCLLDEHLLPLRFSTAGGRHLAALGLGFLLRSLLCFVPWWSESLSAAWGTWRVVTSIWSEDETLKKLQ